MSSASVLFLPPSCLPPFLCFLGLPLRLCAYRPSSALASLAPSLHPVSKPRPSEAQAQAPHPVSDFPFSSSSPMPLASQAQEAQAPTRCQEFIKHLKRSSSVVKTLKRSCRQALAIKPLKSKPPSSKSSAPPPHASNLALTHPQACCCLPPPSLLPVRLRASHLPPHCV
ncbi:hypothetical protein B0H11DRAFT_2029425 [Mycena galericulata]|nr:hypothetical protein B0H11DRAFT_2047184 [Mycena galericulata]KAJ7477850.1 hypothetical protein B0H11DRAFT_2029425 [Mycena galericulata]